MTGKPFEDERTPRDGAADQGAGKRRWRLRWPWRAARAAGQSRAADQTGSEAFSGSLAEVSLLDVLRLLASLRKSGRLALESGRWAGEVWLHEGSVVAASRGAEQGLDALDALALTFGRGAFVFHETAHVPPCQFAQPLAAGQVAARIEQVPLERLAAVVGDATAVPRAGREGGEDAARPNRSVWGPPPPVVLEPPLLRFYLAIDGSRTVEQLAARFGLARTARSLASLVELGLVRVDAVDEAAGVGGVTGVDGVADVRDLTGIDETLSPPQRGSAGRPGGRGEAFAARPADC